jgi:hypothetical protein
MCLNFSENYALWSPIYPRLLTLHRFLYGVSQIVVPCRRSSPKIWSPMMFSFSLLFLSWLSLVSSVSVTILLHLWLMASQRSISGSSICVWLVMGFKIAFTVRSFSHTCVIARQLFSQTHRVARYSPCNSEQYEVISTSCTCDHFFACENLVDWCICTCDGVGWSS